MPTFTPPISDLTDPVLDDPVELEKNPLGYALFRHFKSRAQGRNVFEMNDGSITEDPDTLENVATTWYGGHGPYTVTEAQKTALEAAGYEVS